ncbi:AAA domain-containing protein [Deinococcus arenicola]|uniref:AAA domain-containing protein n=1 Tax=Deinococcus arenicola TaxID=2994950 RepID=A0ABU4DMR6_9DEIO|nr:AAA domain-containing protein [Deinococcus sp. ZS9-10]MDV6373394.1 AAA domain-containing protein [Deinococcus sp. ZS9-10]
MQTPIQLDRSARLFQFLQEFTQLKYKPKRTNDDSALLWLHALPEQPEVDNAARAPEASAPEVWLSVRKPRLRPAPARPDELQPWVSGPLSDPLKAPEIQPQRLVDSVIQDDDLLPQAIRETLFLDEQPDVVRAWKSYEGQWQRWASEELRTREVQKVYSQLFDFHQKLSNFAETYELRLGLGALSWRTPGGHEIRRHLLTARAELTFDALRGVLSVTAAGDGARTTLEQDMLDAGERVGSGVQASIEATLKDSGEDLWAAEVLPAELKKWVHAAGDRGTYEHDLRPPRGVTEHPTVHWAPALILRPRGERSLAAAYSDIIGQLPQLGELPENLRGFIERVEDPVSPQEPGGSEETVYFPLPANDAQQEIVRRLGRQRGVLVQGPPGTGKSHTIVNLVSHLLATDQRVLVTSHTARALKVLRDKFPPELASLCVTHLRGEEGARAMLERSVGEILNRSAARQPWQEDEDERRLFSMLERARQDENRLLDTLRQIRQAETDLLDIFSYRGSAQHIGGQLRDQEPGYGWLDDLNDAAQNVPLSDAEALRLLTLSRTLSEDQVREAGLGQPDPTQLATPDNFVRLVRAEQEARTSVQERQQVQSSAPYPFVAGASPETRAELVRAVQALATAAESERRRPIPWLTEAVDAALKQQAGRWKEVEARSAALLPELLKRAEWLEGRTVTGLDGREPPAVQVDAVAVLEHLKGGGGWGNWLSKPAAVKNRLYLKDLTVGGRPAATPEGLQDLLDHLRLSADLDRVGALWAAVGVQVSGPLKLRVTELDEQRQALAGLSQLAPLLRAAQDAVRAIPGLDQPQWWVAGQLTALVDAVQAADREADLRIRRQLLEDALPSLQALATQNAHPVVGQLIRAIDARDPGGYGHAYLELGRVAANAALWRERQELEQKLRASAPTLADDLVSTPHEPIWDDRLASFGAAWRWTQANGRLTLLANPDAEDEVREQLAGARQVQRETLGQLAAVKAWRNALSRMRGPEQQALVRWQRAVKSLGKGTGKHAERHRQVARLALEEARTAIPAWIMPLHLVAETFGMSAGMFDVVIVDEASQAGPEALFLTFIANKIIVVGDDKQIEPEAVGIQLDKVEDLKRRYLYDFPAPEIITDPKSSLFSFGEYTYSPMISLREHFRCMPEIIKFSSDLSYPDQPLIALRQFGAERLRPIVTHHVEGGYTMPVRGDKVNPAEVSAIVDQIKACIVNPKYAGKTFGVISLLGNAQAEQIAVVLRTELSEAEIEARQLVCGNAYSFQGDERDVIFLSMVVAPNDGKVVKLGRDSAIFQPRYNVAVSRARDQLWVFHSVELPDLHPDDLRASLIRHARAPEIESVNPLSAQKIQDLREEAARPGRGNRPPPAPFDSFFELDVYLAAVARGYRVIPQYAMNGYRIDLVVEGLRGRLAVECDGDFWHGPEKYSDDLARQQVLERAGMEFWRVRGSTFARDPDAALESLWPALDRRGVFPEGDPRNFTPLLTDAPVPSAQSNEPLTGEVSETAASIARRMEQAPIEDTASEVIAPRSTGTGAALAPYAHWAAHTLPDPRAVGSFDPVIDGLREIVAAEGPMTCRQAYQTYCRAAGINFGQTVKSALNKAMTRALRAGVFEQADEWGTAGQVDKVVRLSGSPVVVRRERGPRDLLNIPPSEVGALMRELMADDPGLRAEGTDPLFRQVLSVYGAQRLTAKTRQAMERAYALDDEVEPAVSVAP